MSLKERFAKFAALHDLKLKDDDDMIAALVRSEARHGVPVCPCMLISTRPSASEILAARCPCKDVMLIDKGRLNECHCGLFFKEVNEYSNGG